MSEFLEPGKYRFKIVVEPDPQQVPAWCNLVSMMGVGTCVVKPRTTEVMVKMKLKNWAIAEWHKDSGGAHCSSFTVSKWSFVKI